MIGNVGCVTFASGHTATNTPDLFRTPKLTVAGPGQYWGGGPPGKPFGCCWLFRFLIRDLIISFFSSLGLGFDLPVF